MRYWGKFVGVLLGLMSGIGFWGVVLGFLIGHMFDKSRAIKRQGYFANQQQRQGCFSAPPFRLWDI